MPNWQPEGRKAQKPPHVIQHITFKTTNKEKVQRAAADSWAAKCDHNAVCLSVRSPKETCDEKGAAAAQPHKTWTGAFWRCSLTYTQPLFQLWFISIVAHILHFATAAASHRAAVITGCCRGFCTVYIIGFEGKKTPLFHWRQEQFWASGKQMQMHFTYNTYNRAQQWGSGSENAINILHIDFDYWP